MTCFCVRCGEELTAPKFHNGKPYGYSCFEIVAGKKSKDKRKFVKVDLVGVLPETHGTVKVSYQGRTYNLGGCFRDTEGKLHSSLAEFSVEGEIYMVTHDRKGTAMWKSIQ